MTEEQGSGYGRGLDFLMRQRARFQAQGGDFVRKHYLTTDGMISRYRYLTDYPDVFAHNFHEVQVQGKRKAFTKDVLCTRAIGPVGEEGDYAPVDPPDRCELCNRSEPLPMWWKGICWVYVYKVFSPTKVSDRYQPAKRGPMVGFAETISETRLMILKGIVAEKTYTAAGTYGTLVDRDYELHRLGMSGASFYDIIGLDRGEPPEEVLKALESLPDLSETVMKEFSLRSEQPAAAPAETAGEAPPDFDAGPRAPAPKQDEIVEF